MQGIKRFFSSKYPNQKHAPDAVPASTRVFRIFFGRCWRLLSSFYDRYLLSFGTSGGSTDIPCRC